MNQVDYQPVRTAEDLAAAENTAMFRLRHLLYAVSPRGDIYSANVGNPRWTPLCHGAAFHGRTYYASCAGPEAAYFHGGFNVETREYFSDILVFSGSRLEVLERRTFIPVREHAMGLFTFQGQRILVGFGGYMFDSRGARVSDAAFVYFTGERRLLVLSPDLERFHTDFPEYDGRLVQSHGGGASGAPGGPAPAELSLELARAVGDWPEGRYGHAIATVDNRVLMYGGHNGLAALGDLWELCPAYGSGGLELSWRRVEPHLGAGPGCSNLCSGGSGASVAGGEGGGGGGAGGDAGAGVGSRGPLRGPGRSRAGSRAGSRADSRADSRTASQAGSGSLGISSLASQKPRRYDPEAEMEALRADGTPSRLFFGLGETPGRLYHHTCLACGKALILVSGVGNPSGAFWVYDGSANRWTPSRVRYPLVGFGLPLTTDGEWIYSTTFRVALADVLLYGGGTALDVAQGVAQGVTGQG